MDQYIFIHTGTCEFPISLCFKNIFKTHKELTKLNTECKKKPHVGGFKTRTTETSWDRGHAHLGTVLKHQLYSGIQNTFLKISSLQKFKTRLAFNIQPPLKHLSNFSISSWQNPSNQEKKKKKDKWRPQSCTESSTVLKFFLQSVF